MCNGACEWVFVQWIRNNLDRAAFRTSNCLRFALVHNFSPTFQFVYPFIHLSVYPFIGLLLCYFDWIKDIVFFGRKQKQSLCNQLCIKVFAEGLLSDCSCPQNSLDIRHILLASFINSLNLTIIIAIITNKILYNPCSFFTSDCTDLFELLFWSNHSILPINCY